MSAAPLLVAHQGGWDEILLILTPIAIFAGLLGLANRRADTEARTRAPGPPPDAPSPDSSTDPDRGPSADQDHDAPDHRGPRPGTESGPAPPPTDG